LGIYFLLNTHAHPVVGIELLKRRLESCDPSIVFHTLDIL